MNKKPTDYDAFETELLRRPGVKKAYEELAEKYERVRSRLEWTVSLLICEVPGQVKTGIPFRGRK